MRRLVLVLLIGVICFAIVSGHKAEEHKPVHAHEKSHHSIHEKAHHEKIHHERAHHERVHHEKARHDKAHHISNRHHHSEVRHHGHHSRPLGYRANDDQCTWVCQNSSANSDRQVLYKPSLIAIISKPAKVVVILDYSSGLFVVLNVKRSSIDVIDIANQLRYYLNNEADTLKSIWPNFEDYFQKLPSLQAFLKLGQEKGEKSKLDSLEEPVRGDLEEAVTGLGGTSSVPEVRALLIKFIEQLKGPLSLVYKGSGSFKIASGVDGFAKVNLAVAELLGYWDGKLTPENANLNAAQIFKAESGAQVLLNVLSQAGIHFDLSKVFSGLITSPEKVISLLKNASSGSHDGLDGLITILLNYAELFTGRGSIDQLVTSVLNYNSRPGDGQSLNDLANQTLTIALNQDRVFHNAPGFSIYVAILRGIIDCNYTTNNVNISDIITLLTSRSPRNRLNTLVKVLSSFNPAVTIPHFFRSIIRQFSQTLGGGSIPGLGSGGPFEHIVNSFTSIPVFGPIIGSIIGGGGDHKGGESGHSSTSSPGGLGGLGSLIGLGGGHGESGSKNDSHSTGGSGQSGSKNETHSSGSGPLGGLGGLFGLGGGGNKGSESTSSSSGGATTSPGSGSGDKGSSPSPSSGLGGGITGTSGGDKGSSSSPSSGLGGGISGTSGVDKGASPSPSSGLGGGISGTIGGGNKGSTDGHSAGSSGGSSGSGGGEGKGSADGSSSGSSGGLSGSAGGSSSSADGHSSSSGSLGGLLGSSGSGGKDSSSGVGGISISGEGAGGAKGGSKGTESGGKPGGLSGGSLEIGGAADGGKGGDGTVEVGGGKGGGKIEVGKDGGKEGENGGGKVGNSKGGENEGEKGKGGETGEGNGKAGGKGDGDEGGKGGGSLEVGGGSNGAAGGQGSQVGGKSGGDGTLQVGGTKSGGGGGKSDGSSDGKGEGGGSFKVGGVANGGQGGSSLLGVGGGETKAHPVNPRHKPHHHR